MAIEILSTAAPTSTGNQTITDVGNTATVGAAMHIQSSGIVDGTIRSSQAVGFGWALNDGTTTGHGAVGFAADNGVGTSNTGRMIRDANIVAVPTGSGGASAEADWSSWPAGPNFGLIINWSNAFGTAFDFITALIEATEYANVFHDHFQIPASQSADFSRTGPGFKPHVLIFLHSDQRTAGSTADAVHTIGICVRDNSDVVTQFSIRVGDDDAVGTTNSGSGFDTGAVLGFISGGSTWDTRNRWKVKSMDTNGYTMELLGTAHAQARRYHAFCMELNSGDAAALIRDQLATSGATQVFSGASLTPRLAFGVTIATTSTDAAGAGLGIGWHLFTDEDEFSVTTASQDAQGTSNTNTLWESKACVLLVEAGTKDYQATFLSFDSDGFTLTIGTAAASAWESMWLVIGTPTAAGADPLLGGLALLGVGR